MASLTSILPFWRQPFRDEPVSVRPAKQVEFGTASGFELQFGGLIDDLRTDALFSTGRCRP